MKKLLFILAGTTLGFAKENVQNNEVVTISNESKTATAVVENKEAKKAEDSSGCTMSFITREYNNCGEYQGSYVDSIELPGALCGSMDNGLMMFVSNINNGFGDCW